VRYFIHSLELVLVFIDYNSDRLIVKCFLVFILCFFCNESTYAVFQLTLLLVDVGYYFNCRSVWPVATLTAVEYVLKATSVALINQKEPEALQSILAAKSTISAYLVVSLARRHITICVNILTLIARPFPLSLKFKMAYVFVLALSTPLLSRSHTSWLAGSSAFLTWAGAGTIWRNVKRW